jgi:hypothetical protein
MFIMRQLKLLQMHYVKLLGEVHMLMLYDRKPHSSGQPRCDVTVVVVHRHDHMPILVPLTTDATAEYMMRIGNAPFQH